MSYTIKAGDTLGNIAQHFTGNAGRWGELAVENPGLDPRRLRVGATLTIPASWARAPDTAATTPQDAPTRPEIHSWRTLPDGLIEVDGRPPTLGGTGAKLFDQQVAHWAAICIRVGAVFGVPPHWLLGMIYRESGGNPFAHSADAGFGLMQITSAAARAGHTDGELYDAETNIRLGAKLIAAQRRAGDQLPEAASKYNAGASADGKPHPSAVSPWGMRETAGHISSVVAAANYALRYLERIGASVAGGGLVLFVGVGIALAWWLS
jgi:hypothetical protein